MRKQALRILGFARSEPSAVRDAVVVKLRAIIGDAGSVGDCGCKQESDAGHRKDDFRTFHFKRSFPCPCAMNVCSKHAIGYLYQQTGSCADISVFTAPKPMLGQS
jgi:hypothetical protein